MTHATMLESNTQLPRYNIAETYRWNYERAPEDLPEVLVPPMAGSWTYCGRPVPSPLAVAAGPLLNGRWVLYYAALGFDVLTYKTTRSQHRECYPLPNLQPVQTSELATPGQRLNAVPIMDNAWAISFGMPSKAPDIWRADVEWTRKQLPPEKLLVVSVVASVQPGDSVDELADDFARCARWAIDSGADCVETNFSCPNVSTIDGQLFQNPELAAIVAQRVREAVGPVPYLIKLGFVDSDELAGQLLDAVAPFADALAMTNSITATVAGSDGQLLFGGQARGIGGSAIRHGSIGQVERFSRLVRQRGLAIRIIGGGGIAQADHVRQYLDAGAEAVQIATAAMLDPLVACRIRQDWDPDKPEH